MVGPNEGFCPPGSGSEYLISYFGAFDGVVGVLLLIFFIYFSINTVRDLLSSKTKPPGLISAQASYMTALFMKSLSFIVVAFCRKRADQWSGTSLLTIGLSGYFVAIAYCFIFFSWTSVCVTYIGQDFDLFHYWSNIIMKSLMSITVFLFIAASLLTLFSDEPTLYHTFEAVAAAVRDFAISIAFLFYLLRIFKLTERPYYCTDKPEASLFSMCTVLIVALFLRGVSILTYAFYWANWSVFRKDQPSKECTKLYFCTYVVEQTLYELVPMMMIGIVRLKQLKKSSYVDLNNTYNTYSFTD